VIDEYAFAGAPMLNKMHGVEERVANFSNSFLPRLFVYLNLLSNVVWKVFLYMVYFKYAGMAEW